MSGYPSVDAQFAQLRFVDMDLADTPDMFKTASDYASRNRWQDVLPNETTLFPPLPPKHQPAKKDGVKGGGGPFYYPYLNANFVDPENFFGIPHAFVACQAPIPKQFDDFWYVIGQYRVPLIVMLTQEVEKRAVKAHPYWPQEVNRPVLIRAHNPPVHGAISAGTHVAYILTMTKEVREEKEDMVRRTFDLHAPKQEVGSEEVGLGELVHRVEHVQYLGWPDYGVPKDASKFVKIVKQIQAAPMTSSHFISAATGKSKSANIDQYIHDMCKGQNLGAGPIVTHCSAGIGRAGTLLATYVGIHVQTVLKGKVTPELIFDIVKKLKVTRSGMVQRPEQLAFVYKCLNVTM